MIGYQLFMINILFVYHKSNTLLDFVGEVFHAWGSQQIGLDGYLCWHYSAV
jgi:hypothetical protein